MFTEQQLHQRSVVTLRFATKFERQQSQSHAILPKVLNEDGAQSFINSYRSQRPRVQRFVRKFILLATLNTSTAKRATRFCATLKKSLASSED